MNRVTVIADLVGSRKIRDRKTTQERLQGVLKEVSRQSRPHLLSPYTLTLGDEFQAVLSSADTIFRDAFTVCAALYPVHVRFSFGIGAIETRINPRQAIGMDGPAFHIARKGMEGLKKSEGIFSVDGISGEAAGLIKHSLDLLGHACSKWNGTRLTIFKLMFEQMPVNLMAKQLGITDKGVYKSINHGGLRIAAALLEETSRLINRELPGK